MSRDCCHYVYVLWITFQLMAFTYFGDSAMAIANFDPYISEFEYGTQFHPSENPECPNGWALERPENNPFRRSHFSSLRSRRSPEEGSPVGQEPSIEVRAILVRCPRTEEETDDVLINRNIYNITAGRSQDILDFHGFDRDEPAQHSQVRDCHRKLIITMKFNNIGKTKTQEEFVVIDHVLDPVTMHKSRLLNPFVVKVRQESVLQLYGLKFQGVVNAEAREEVLNKKSTNYTGCDDISENPTCGQMIFEGKPIPYSQGFCCSCDPELNIQRQAMLSNETSVPPFASFLSKYKNGRIRPFKNPRSISKNTLDGPSSSENASHPTTIKKETNHSNPVESMFVTDSNVSLTKNVQDEETDLVNLKNSFRLVEKNRYLSNPDSSEKFYWNQKLMKNRYTSVGNSGRDSFNAELSKLEEDYNNFRRSNSLKTEGQINKNVGHDEAKFLSLAKSQDKIRFYRQEYKTTNIYPRELTASSTDVLFATKPNQNPPTCYPLSLYPAGQERLESAVEVPPVRDEKHVRFFRFRTEENSRKINTQIVSSTEVAAVLQVEVTFEIPNNLHSTNETTQIFDYPTGQADGLGNLLSSSSSRNPFKGDAILLSGSLKNQLADWLSYGKRKKSSRGNDIQDGEELEIIEMAVSTMKPANLLNGQSEDELTTVDGIQNSVSGDFNPDQNDQKLHATKNEIWIPRTREIILRHYRSVNDDNTVSSLGVDQQRSIDKKIEVEFVNISRVLKDAADGPKIFTGRPNSDSPFEKDNSVIEKFELILNDTPYVIIDPTENRTAVDVKDGLLKATERPDLPGTLDHVLTGRLTSEQAEVVSTIRQNLPRKSIDSDKPITENTTNDNHQSVTETTILKHKEDLGEPISKIPQNTQHQIVVDRFKLVTNYQEFPTVHGPMLDASVATDPSSISPKMRDLAPQQQPWFSIDTIDPENATETSRYLNSRVLPDGLKSVDKHRDTLTGEPIHEIKELVSNTPQKPAKIVWSKQDPIMKNHDRGRGYLSPVMMIEHLKKELRKESQRKSSSSQSRGVKGIPSLFSPQGEVKTEFTPAVKVENSITNGETLSPDEKTILTTVASNMPIYTNVSAITPHETGHPVSSRVAFRRLETNMDKKSYPVPSHEMLILLQEPSPSLNFYDRRNKKKRRHPRHRYRRSRHKRRPVEMERNVTRDISPAINNEHVVVGKSENEDDEHPWCETSTDSEKIINSSRIQKRIATGANSLKNLTRRDISINLINTNDDRQKEDEYLKEKSSSGKLQVSLSRIPESDYSAKVAGLRVEEIPKIKAHEKWKAQTETNADDVSSIISVFQSQQEGPNEVDEMPVFPGTVHPRIAITTDIKAISMGEGRIRKRNFPSKPKFRSLYPKSNEIASIADTFQVISKNNKRDDLLNSDENEKKNFYDYDIHDSDRAGSLIVSSSNGNDKSIIDNVGKKEKRLQARQLIVNPSDFVSQDSHVIGESKYFTTHPDHQIHSTLLNLKNRRSVNVSYNQYQIEPSSGWKAKMELLKLKKHADVLKEYLNWHHDIVPPEPHDILGYTRKISMTSHSDDGTTLSITSAAYSPASNDISSTSHDDDDTALPTIRNLSDDVRVNENNGTGTSKSTQYCPISNTDETKKIDTSTYSDVRNKVSYHTEAFTGKILPPCCRITHKSVSTCPTGFHRNDDRLSSLSSKTLLTPPNGRKISSDLKNDLVIISAMEKKLTGQIGGRNLPRVYEIRKESVSVKSPQHRHYKVKTNHKFRATGISENDKRPVRRRLMSIDNEDYKIYDDDDDPDRDALEDDLNLAPSVNGNRPLDDTKDDKDLRNRWDNLINKVIHTNSSDLWEPPKSEKTSLPELANDNHHALKHLHFINADKYIKQIAKKIAHGTSIHESKHEIEVFENKDNVLLGRKLKSITRNKITREIKMKVNNEDHADSNDDVQESLVKSSGEGPSGRDFAISLSGKIHVEGGTNGQPMSISFDTSPEIIDKKETPDPVNSTNADTNFLSTIFNIASAPERMANHSQQVNGTTNSTSLNRQSLNLRASRAGHHTNLQRVAQKSAFARKSRAADKRLPKYRGDRSLDLEDIPEADSEVYPESAFRKFDFKDDDDPNDTTANLGHSSSNFNENSTNETSHSNSPGVRIIKIIPVDVSRSSPFQSTHNTWQGENKEYAEAVETGLKSPQSEAEPVPDVIVKPGKIKPAELPWQNNRDNDQDISQQDSRASCPLEPEFTKENLDSSNVLASDRRVSENKPLNLKIIDLVSMEQPLIKDSKHSNEHNRVDFDTIPLIHLRMQQQPDKEFVANDYDRPTLVPSKLIGGCPEIEVRKSFQQYSVGGSSSCFDADKTKDDGNAEPNVGIKMECEDHQKTTMTSRPICQGASEKFGTRKLVRIKNMLAIMEFMKKIKQIIGGEGIRDVVEIYDRKPVTDLARVVVLPIGRSKDILSTPEEMKEVTDPLEVIGGGINHGNPQTTDTFDDSHLDMKEPNSISTKSSASHKSEDQDKDFLFYGNENMAAMKQTAFKDPKYVEFPSIDSGQENIIDSPNEAIREQSLKANSTNPFTIHPTDVSGANHEPEVKNAQENNGCAGRSALQNSQPKMDDSVYTSTNGSGNTNERQNLTISPEKDRSIPDNNYSLVTKVKRRLRSNLSQPRERLLLRYRSSPDRRVSEFRKFRRLAAGKGGTTGKQEPTRRKKKRRRKKKKQKKKKKGKHHRNTDVSQVSQKIKGRHWWPFGRQLMSLSIKQDLVFDTNSDDDRIEEIKSEGKIFVDPFAQKQRRKVHRAKFTNGQRRKTKKGRKHKKRKQKKNKNGGNNRKAGLRSKRQIRAGGTQVRGGQDCMDRSHSSNVNPAKYLESAHCLRFSDLWYSVYELEAPIMEHTVFLQLFEKHNRADGTAHWEDLTQGSMVRMGTFTRHQRDSKPTIVFTYSGAKTESQNRAMNLDPSRQRLLVPSPVPPNKASDYPEVKGGSGEYLVVQSNAITKDGNECDKAGVGFTAFSKQQDRCGRAKNTCLKNQPLAYWRHDMKAREAGRPGCYFLSNFASVPTNPIKYNVTGSGGREYLGLEYHSSHVSAIDIQVRTDNNAIVRVGSSGRVTEVHIDSTALEHTVVTIVISNMGLTSSPYQPRITDCPTGLPVSWTKAKGIMQVVPPQHDQRVTLDLYGQLFLNGFHCSGNDVFFAF